MIEAGVRTLWESGAVETPMDGVDQLLVERIFVGDVSRVKRAVIELSNAVRSSTTMPTESMNLDIWS